MSGSFLKDDETVGQAAWDIFRPAIKILSVAVAALILLGLAQGAFSFVRPGIRILLFLASIAIPTRVVVWPWIKGVDVDASERKKAAAAHKVHGLPTGAHRTCDLLTMSQNARRRQP